MILTTLAYSEKDCKNLENVKITTNLYYNRFINWHENGCDWYHFTISLVFTINCMWHTYIKIDQLDVKLKPLVEDRKVYLLGI